MDEFRLTVGIPASGKSTLAQLWAEQEGFVVVSSDAVRLALTGSMEDFSAENAVWETVKLRIGMVLHRGDSVVLDATNLVPRFREQWLDLARLWHVTPIAYRCEIGLAEAMRRNTARIRVVPDSVMARMWLNWAMHCSIGQLEAEGFTVR